MPLQFNPGSSMEDIINGIMEENQKPSQRDSGPTIGFLPDGRHLIRFFLDPTAKLFRETKVGRVGKRRFVCPDWMSRHDKTSDTIYPDCELDAHCREHEEKWRDACRYHCMVYGVLYKTNNQSEYWKVEDGKPTPYLIVGNSKLKQALLDMLGTLREHGMDMLVAMLNPTSRGVYAAVTVTKGQQGSISIQVLTNSVDPIQLDEWYIPLSEAFMKNEFDEKMYRDAMSEYKANLAPEPGSAEAEAASILDDMDGEGNEVEEIALTSTSSVSQPTTTEFEFPDEDEEAEVVPAPVAKATPAPAKTKKAPVAKKAATLPDNITLEMLPEECPGWGNYSNDNRTCGLCDYNLECMTLGDAKS